MTSFSIYKFKSELNKAGGFSRSHLFRCNFGFGPNTPLVLSSYPNTRAHPLMCKSSRLPGFNLEPTQLHYMTKEVSIPGNRVNRPFTATFYATNDYSAYEFFTTWQKLILSPESNRRGTFDLKKKKGDQIQEIGLSVSPNSLYADITLEHFSPESSAPAFLESTPILGLFIFGDNIPVATYELKNAYPTSISGLEFDYDNDSQVQMYTVEFNYLSMDYFTTKNNNTPSLSLGLGAVRL